MLVLQLCLQVFWLVGLANELNQRNQRLEQEFREVLQANGLDLLHDQVEIERIRKKMGLPKEQTHEIIIQLVREKLLEDQQQEKKEISLLSALW